MAKYEYYVNLDERGEFNADVRNEDGDTVWQMVDIEDVQGMVDFGLIKHGKDLDGIESYLKMVGHMNENDTLVKAN